MRLLCAIPLCRCMEMRLRDSLPWPACNLLKLRVRFTSVQHVSQLCTLFMALRYQRTVRIFSRPKRRATKALMVEMSCAACSHLLVRSHSSTGAEPFTIRKRFRFQNSAATRKTGWNIFTSLWHSKYEAYPLAPYTVGIGAMLAASLLRRFDDDPTGD
jgi:hypothetical protein